MPLPSLLESHGLQRIIVTTAIVAIASLAVHAQEYDVPDPIIQVFQPKGLRVSIPDSEGVELFAFHANVNQPLEGVEAGELSADVNRKGADGRWTYFNPSRRLRVGDVLHYWLYVQREGRGYQRLRQRHRVADLLPFTSESEPHSKQIAFADRPVAGLSGQSAVNDNAFEYRPPVYETYPTPAAAQPAPYDPYRPPPRQPPPPPPDASRPSRPPPQYQSQPPPGAPPPGPPPGNHYGARPPPPPEYNHQYPPPPPPSQPVEQVTHNHHVGFASNNNNYNTGDRYPTTGITSTGNNNGDRYPTSSSNTDRYPTSGSNTDRYPTSSSNTDRYPTSSSNTDRYPTSGSNTDRYPSSSSNTDRYPASTISNNKYPQVVYQPDSSDVTFSAASPTAAPAAPAAPAGPGGSWGDSQGGQGGQGLPLTSGDAFAAGSSRPQPSQSSAACELSVTYVNGRPACKGQVVFEEDWKTVDLDKWSHEVKISGSPDYEFCVYSRHPENTFAKHGLLHLKPTLTNDRYGADFIRKGKLELEDCTAGPINSDSCTREAMFSYILPPVVASRISTKNSFSFKYGKIEIRTRLPRGDWIYPELWLQPLREEYGPGLASGRIHVAMARGNRNLRGPAPESEDISGRQLVVGALAGGRGGSASARRKFFTHRGDVLWTEQFHNYSVLWTPETLAFSVDGVEIGVARPEEFGGLLHGRADEQADPWAQGSRIAPFDKEFYISLGLAVGGIHAFPDGCRSGNHEKPWKNTAAKAMLSFWNAKDVWHPTWNGQQSELLVESVRVTALNN